MSKAARKLHANLMVGCAAGILHALAGPDHIAAVAPLAFETRGRGVATGVAWGSGHGLGLMFVALILLMMGHGPVPMLSLAGEKTAGVALTLAGASALLASFASKRHGHPAGGIHRHSMPATALGFGVLHGTAGSATVLATSPIVSSGTPAIALFVAGFGLGGMLAMTIVAMLLSSSAVHLSQRTRALGVVRLTLAFAALSVGTWWVIA